MKKLFFLLCSILLVHSMALPQTKAPDPLWTGGEDIDFPGSGAAASASPPSTYYRPGYARGAVYCNTASANNMASPCWSTIFPGGAVTAAWLHFQYRNSAANVALMGLGTYGTDNAVWLYCNGTPATGLYSATSSGGTSLATESGDSCAGGSLTQFDISVTGYGGTATVNVYANAGTVPIITWTGTLSPGGAASFNSVFLGNLGGSSHGASEIIVSTSDTRPMSLVTLAPAGAGTTNTWTSGTYSNIDALTNNVASIINSQASAQNFAATLNALPSGSFTVLGVKVIANGITNGTAPTSIAPGIYSHSTVEVPSATALNAYWFPVETYYSTNPATGVGFTAVDIANLQIYLTSAP
jgi:hypothetical protein